MDYFDSERIKDRIVAKNHLAFAFPSYMPIVPGHLLICPIRPVASFEDLTEEEWQAIRSLQKALCTALQIAFGAEGFNFAWNFGEIAGQSLPHFHLHIVPRKKGDSGIWQYDPRVFLYRPGSRAISAAEELQHVAKQVRDCLPPGD